MWFAVVKKTRTNTRFLLKASRIAVGSKVFQNGCLVRLETTVPSLLFRFDFGRADETELEIEIDYDFALLRYHLADDAAEQQQYKSFFAFQPHKQPKRYRLFSKITTRKVSNQMIAILSPDAPFSIRVAGIDYFSCGQQQE